MIDDKWDIINVWEPHLIMVFNCLKDSFRSKTVKI